MSAYYIYAVMRLMIDYYHKIFLKLYKTHLFFKYPIRNFKQLAMIAI